MPRTSRFIVSIVLSLAIGLTAVSGFADQSPRYANQVAVLMYHHVHDTDKSSGTITPALFRDQLAYLQDEGYSFITLDQFRGFMDGSGEVPDNAVLVTFDDGYESFNTFALPVLQQLQIPAVNFIITDSLAHPKEDVPPKMSADDIRRATAAPASIEAQCHTDAFHGKRDNGKALLLQDSSETDDAYRKRLAADTASCIAKLRAIVDKPVDTLAYPFGIYDSKAAAAIGSAGIRFAFTIAPGMAVASGNPMNIPRINGGNPHITPKALQKAIVRRIVAGP